jgi:hypothetical protein
LEARNSPHVILALTSAESYSTSKATAVSEALAFTPTFFNCSSTSVAISSSFALDSPATTSCFTAATISKAIVVLGIERVVIVVVEVVDTHVPHSNGQCR